MDILSVSSLAPKHSLPESAVTCTISPDSRNIYCQVFTPDMLICVCVVLAGRIRLLEILRLLIWVM